MTHLTKAHRIRQTSSSTSSSSSPGATIVRAESDARDGEHEVHLTTSDGTVLPVKLDKNIRVGRCVT